MVMREAESIVEEASRPTPPILVPAWRRVGVSVLDAGSIEEAMETAGLNWQVALDGLYLRNGEKVDAYNAVTRSDTRDVLGVVGTRYEPFQNVDAFRWLDALLGDGVKYETAGALKGGKLVWVLARLPGAEAVAGDAIAKYLLVANGHDGFAALSVKFTPVRVVCENTLRMALGGAGAAWKAHHTMAITGRVEEARRVLDAANGYFGRAIERMKELARVRLDAAAVQAFAGRLFDIKADRVADIFGGSAAKGKELGALEVVRLTREGRGNSRRGIEGTAWAAFNGATEWYDYYRASKLGDLEAADRRTGEILTYADGQNYRQRAWDILAEMTGSTN